MTNTALSFVFVVVEGVDTKNRTSEEGTTSFEVQGPGISETPPDVHLLDTTLPETIGEGGEDGGGETSEVGGLTIIEATLPAFRRRITDLEGRDVSVEELITVEVAAATNEPGDVDADEGCPEDDGVCPLGTRIVGVDLTGGVAGDVVVHPEVDHDTIDVEAAFSGGVGLDVGDDFWGVDEVVDGVPTPHTDTITMATEHVSLTDVGVGSGEISDRLVTGIGVTRVTEFVEPRRPTEPVHTISTVHVFLVVLCCCCFVFLCVMIIVVKKNTQ